MRPTSCRLGQELRKADDETFARISGAATRVLLPLCGRTGLTAAIVSNGFLVMVLRGWGATAFALGLTPVKGCFGRVGEKARAERRCRKVLPGFFVLATLLKFEDWPPLSVGRARGTGPEINSLAIGRVAVVACCLESGFRPRTPLISPLKRLKIPITELPRSAVSLPRVSCVSDISMTDDRRMAVRNICGNAVVSFIPG